MYSLSRAGRSVALNEAERANAQMLFEIKKLFAPAFGRCRIFTYEQTNIRAASQTCVNDRCKKDARATTQNPTIRKIQKMKLETKIRNLINQTNPDADARFNVVAHELWGNSQEGYSTNSSWYIATNADLSQVLEAARGRWEVFKVNYLPKARVSDISDTGFSDDLSLEVDCIPFLEIRTA